tara:strand:+ start:64 stop:252 length:189 start_codon:yes stop_codon:yes gene_type:complete
MTKPIGNCKYCDKPLRAFGKERKNGKSHDDWETREYHKKCFKYNINRNYQKIKKFIELYNDE